MPRSAPRPVTEPRPVAWKPLPNPDFDLRGKSPDFKLQSRSPALLENPARDRGCGGPVNLCELGSVRACHVVQSQSSKKHRGPGGNLSDRLSHVTIMYNCVNENEPCPLGTEPTGPPPTCRLSPRLCGVGRAVRHAEVGWSALRVTGRKARRARCARSSSPCVNHFTHTHTHTLLLCRPVLTSHTHSHACLNVDV